MKKIIAFLLIFVMIAGLAGCKGNKGNEVPDAEPGTWEFYNAYAEKFVKLMADGDFDAATDMLDAAMLQLMPATVLKDDFWDLIVGQTGKFIDIHDIENLEAEGYYICFVTSRHENTGVKLRVVFSEDGLIAGLFIDDYPEIADD